MLLCIAQEPAIRLRDVAERVGITERAVQRIVADLEEAGYLSREREGRRNHYELHTDRPFRHPVVAHRDVSLLLSLFVRPAVAAKAEPTPLEVRSYLIERASGDARRGIDRPRPERTVRLA